MIPSIILAIEDDDDREFMTWLYKQYQRLMYREILKIVQETWDVDDIMQSLLVKLIGQIALLKTLDRQHLIDYLVTAARNTALNFRRDNKLDTRQFQMAFRTLRQLSVQIDSSERELDIDATIHDTCENGGLLKMQTRPPRKNNVKVLLLMDSGGSMEYYSNLCSMLFQAATKSNYFKELHTYYFHNSIGSNLYTEPRLWYVDAVSTEWILENFDSSYKVIIVSDAAMNPNELHEKQFVWGTGTYMRSSYEWLLLFRKQYPYLIWLNPETIPEKASYWTQTQVELADIFQMFHLSANGLEAGMKCLLVRQ